LEYDRPFGGENESHEFRLFVAAMRFPQKQHNCG